MNPGNLSEHERVFFEDGYRLGKEAAKHTKNEPMFLAYISEMYQAIDGLIDSILAMARKQNVSVDCKNGCEYCCHQAVYANSYELHYLGNFIKSNFSPEQKDDIQLKAEKKNKTTSSLSQEQVLKYKSPCPLLVKGSCSAYAARPMACRIYLSMKVGSCIEFFKNPDNENNYPQLLDFPLIAGRMMNEGFTAALREAGTETAEFRLEEGLESVLKYGAKL